MALGGAGAITALIVMLLGATGGSERDQAHHCQSGRSRRVHLLFVSQSISHRQVARWRPSSKTAALLCTDFACMRDVRDLQQLLARAGDVMDGRGTDRLARNPRPVRSFSRYCSSVQRRHACAPADRAARSQQRGGGRLSLRRRANRAVAARRPEGRHRRSDPRPARLHRRAVCRDPRRRRSIRKRSGPRRDRRRPARRRPYPVCRRQR